MKFIIILLSLLVSTVVSVWIIKKKNNKWISMFSAFTNGCFSKDHGLLRQLFFLIELKGQVSWRGDRIYSISHLGQIMEESKNK